MTTHLALATRPSGMPLSEILIMPLRRSAAASSRFPAHEVAQLVGVIGKCSQSQSAANNVRETLNRASIDRNIILNSPLRLLSVLGGRTCFFEAKSGLRILNGFFMKDPPEQIEG